MLGSMYIVANFMGTTNCSSILLFVATERIVLYRERFAGMFSPWAYSFAQMVIEIPYIFVQVVIFVVITYPAIGYDLSALKFYTMFCTLLYFVYLGMLLVSLTPNVQVASILSSPCYAIINLFSGFMIPGPQIPEWWIWLYYISPLSWTVNGLFTSHYGDIDKKITVFGETKSVANFLKDYFGFQHNHLGVVGVILIVYPLIYGSIFG